MYEINCNMQQVKLKKHQQQELSEWLALTETPTESGHTSTESCC